MCIGDWRLGRLITIQQTAFTLNVGNPTQVFGSNRQRVGVNVAITGAALAGASAVQVVINGFNTFLLQAGINYVHWDLLGHGGLPLLPFTVQRVATDVTGVVVEYFLTEDILSAGLNEFNSKYKP